MRRLALLLVPLAALSCGGREEVAATRSDAANPPASAETRPAAGGAAAAPDEAPSDLLADRIWIRIDEGAAVGAMHIFLGSGVLVTDSCWEGYRLSRWTKDGAAAISWNEDGMDISAEIVEIRDDRLTLRLSLAGGAEEQRFERAGAPYVCPDMPR